MTAEWHETLARADRPGDLGDIEIAIRVERQAVRRAEVTRAARIAGVTRAGAHRVFELPRPGYNSGRRQSPLGQLGPLKFARRWQLHAGIHPTCSTLHERATSSTCQVSFSSAATRARISPPLTRLSPNARDAPDTATTPPRQQSAPRPRAGQSPGPVPSPRSRAWPKDRVP